MTPAKFTGLIAVETAWSTLRCSYLCSMPIVVAQTTETATVVLHPAVAFTLAAVFAIAGGLANLWAATDEKLEPRVIIARVLNMGTVGMAGAMVMFSMMSPSDYREILILGIVGIASLSGMKMIQVAQNIGNGLFAKFTESEKR